MFYKIEHKYIRYIQNSVSFAYVSFLLYLIYYVFYYILPHLFTTLIFS